MGFELILAGMIFLVNPVFGVYDILPDVIGWALICGGMKKLRDMAPSLEDSMGLLRWQLILTGAQAAVMLVMPLMSDTGYALVFAFLFSVFGGALTVLFMIRFTDGMAYISVREQSETPVLEVGNVRSMTLVFAVVKAILTILPELTYLSTSEYEGYITALDPFDLKNYGNLLVIVNAAGVLIVGLIWINIVVRWLNRIRRDAALQAAMERYYAENVAPRHGLFFCRALKTALILLGVGCGFQLDILMDGVCFTPDLVGGICFILAFWMMMRYAPGLKKARGLAIVTTALSAAAFALMVWIGLVYYSWGITRSIFGFYLFVAFLVLEAAAALTFVLMLLRMRAWADDLIENHTGEEYEAVFVRLQNESAEMKNELRRSNRAVVVWGILAAASAVLRYALMYFFAPYWIVNLVIGLGWTWVSCTFLMTLWKRVAEKYGLRRPE